MKIKIIYAIVAMVAHLPLHAQLPGGKNMVKVNVSSFVAKGFGIQYEHKLGSRFTAALGYNKIPQSTIAFKSVIQSFINDQQYGPEVKVGDFKLGTSIFTPEIRYYLGKDGAFHGFYFAGYARFGHYDNEGPFSYTTSTGARTDLLFIGSLDAFTGGLMIGSSFKLSKALYLDWWIIGAGVGSADGKFVAKTQLSPYEQQYLKEQLDQLDIKFTTLQSEVNNSGATVTTTGAMVGVRGLGINFGIRF